MKIASDGVCTWSNVGGVAGTAMTLNGTGLGIGNSPIYNLTVKGVLNTVGIINDSSNRSRICFAEYATPANSYTNIEADARSTGYISLRTNDEHRVRIDSSGNVGIGTTTPAYKLDVAAAGAILANAPFSVARITGANAVANDLTLSGPNTSQVRINFGDPENSGVGEIGYNHASNLMRFVVNNGQVHTLGPSGVFTWYDGAGGTRMLLNSSGNLGLGVTPSAWSSSYKAFQMGSGGTSFWGGVNFTEYNQNAYFDGTNYKYVNSFASSKYYQANGAHSWHTAAAGTAGATFTYTQAMLLDASGNMGLGVTPNTWAAVFRAIQFPDGYAAIAGDNGNGVAELLSNAYNDGAWKFRNAQGAVRYRLDAINKTHTWYNSTNATPTANGAITWNPAMTLTAGGVLLLGTASAASSETLRVYNTTNSRLIVDQASNGLVLGADASGPFFDTTGSNRLAFFVGGTQRLSIKSTGQVNFVGQASDPAGAAGDVVYNSTSNRLKYHNGTAWVNTGTNKYSGALAGTGTSFTVTHNLGTRDVTVAVRKSGSTYDQVFTDVQMTDTNTVTIVFASSVTGSDYTVTVIG